MLEYYKNIKDKLYYKLVNFKEKRDNEYFYRNKHFANLISDANIKNLHIEWIKKEILENL